MDHPVACSIGGGTLSGVLRNDALAFCLVNEMPLSRGYLFVWPTSVRQQSPGWSCHCGRDYVGLNLILTNSSVSFSSFPHPQFNAAKRRVQRFCGVWEAFP